MIVAVWILQEIPGFLTSGVAEGAKTAYLGAGPRSTFLPSEPLG